MARRRLAGTQDFLLDSVINRKVAQSVRAQVCPLNEEQLSIHLSRARALAFLLAWTVLLRTLINLRNVCHCEDISDVGLSEYHTS